MPWAAAQGLIVGLPDGRYRAAQPPTAVDPDLALATLAAGTWGLTGQGSRRTVTIRWFRRPRRIRGAPRRAGRRPELPGAVASAPR